MKLLVVAGSASYLAPHALEPEALEQFLRRYDATITCPRPRWDRVWETAPTAALELLLEYAEDVLPRGATACVIATAPDVRAALARRHSTATVEVRRLYWSSTTEGVLAELRRRTGAPAETDEPGLALEPLARWNAEGFAVQRNYTHAVLALAAHVVAANGGVCDPRLDDLSAFLDQLPLVVRFDCDANRIADALAPGGELFELLTRATLPAELDARTIFETWRGDPRA